MENGRVLSAPSLHRESTDSLITTNSLRQALPYLNNKSFNKCEYLYDGKPKYWQLHSTGSYTEPITLHAHAIICTANSV